MSGQGGEAVQDERDPKPCPRCDEVCRYDGWGHVHASGLSIGSCVRTPPERRVHNHAPYRPACNEREVGGQLRGACLNDDGSDR